VRRTKALWLFKTSNLSLRDCNSERQGCVLHKPRARKKNFPCLVWYQLRSHGLTVTTPPIMCCTLSTVKAKSSAAHTNTHSKQATSGSCFVGRWGEDLS
jgi:hypothetical protein